MPNRIERRIFFDVKSHWSYVCILCEKMELAGWKVIMRPDLNAVDIIKYRYDGYELEDDLLKILHSVDTRWGVVRSVFDLKSEENKVKWYE